jgi:hypothetical protein
LGGRECAASFLSSYQMCASFTAHEARGLALRHRDLKKSQASVASACLIRRLFVVLDGDSS